MTGPAAEPSSRTIALGTGLSYHVLEWGADDPGLDHTVILIHGFLDLAWGWVATVRAGLAGRFHIVAPDVRGHGDSDRIGRGGYYHFMDYIADFDDLVEQVGRKRVSLVGHSMGGSIASYYAGAFPERVARLALLEGLGPPESPTPVPERVRAWISGWKRARAHTPRRLADVAEAAHRLRQHDPLLGEELALELAAHGVTESGDGGLCFKHDPLHSTLGPYPFRIDVARSFWERVTCPVLLVEGEKSAFRHAHDEAVARARSFAQVESAVLDGAGHMMQRHRPRELAAVLATFLSA